MNSIEIEAQKARLVRDILTQVDDERLLNKLIHYFRKSIDTANKNHPLAMTNEEMRRSAIASAADKTNITHEEVENEMNNLMKEWK